MLAIAVLLFILWWHCSDKRLGKRGAKDIKGHPFFRQNQWTWEDIRNCKWLYLWLWCALSVTVCFIDIPWVCHCVGHWYPLNLSLCVSLVSFEFVIVWVIGTLWVCHCVPYYYPLTFSLCIIVYHCSHWCYKFITVYDISVPWVCCCVCVSLVPLEFVVLSVISTPWLCHCVCHI